MGESTIELLETGIRVNDLVVPKKAIADFLRDVPEEERELRFIQALEVGTFCLERVSGGRDLEFVRHQVEDMTRRFEAAVAKLPETLEGAIVQKMGDGDGQVLAPVRETVRQVDATVGERLKEVKSLLADDLDPSKSTSTLGSALTRLGELLDPARNDSVQTAIADAVRHISDGNGALASAVRGWVAEAMEPLSKEVSRLGQQFASAAAVDEALQNTTKKGTAYEIEVTAILQAWGARMGVIVEHVGNDNKPGDVIVEFPETAAGSDALRIVIEVRDRAQRVGRKVVARDLSTKMRERQADAGIYLSKTPAGLAVELGDWAEGMGSAGAWVATTDEFLVVAVRWLYAQALLRQRADTRSGVDTTAIQNQVQRVRTALKRITNINRNLTHVSSSVASIAEDAEALRGDIRSSLSAIEDALTQDGAATGT